MKALRHVLNICCVVLIFIGSVFSVSGCDFLVAKNAATPTVVSTAGREPTSEAPTPQVITTSHAASLGATATTYAPTPKVIDPVATQIAQARARRYPVAPADLEVFKHYPGAEDIKDLSATTGGISLFFEFETNDDASVVEAYYRELAKAQGWQPARIETTGFAHAHPYYYFGDYGRAYVYGYYLDFFAVERGQRLKTYARIRVSKSLPIYPGATDVVTKQSSGADFTQTTVEFTTTATPDAVLAFYTDSYPEHDWQLDVEQSSGTKLYWKIGESSFASVRTQTASSGVVRITVVYYSGCCG